MRDPLVRCAVSLGAVIAVLSTGCEPGPNAKDAPIAPGVAPAETVPAAEPEQPPNVILISIDDLRADRLGVYGDERKTAPALDRFAAESVVFDNAYSTSSWTLPSHVSMLSGLHPKTHRAVLQMTKPRDDIPMLSEILRDAGYRTLAVTAGGWVSEGFGFARGFDDFEVVFPPGAAVKRILGDLREIPLDQPYFLFFHTFGVHCPFVVPEKYSEMFDTRPETDRFDIGDGCGDTHFEKMDLTDGQVAFVSDRYDAGIRSTNDQLRWLFTYLGKRGDIDNTIVIVTSDHGEEFKEHGRMGHGRALYAETLRVPLLIRAPGARAGRVSEPTSVVDLTPTVLELAGLPLPEMEGSSLVPRLRRGDAANDPRPIFAETSLRGEKVRSVVADGRQLITDLKTGSTEVFDLARDPEQRAPLSADAAPATGALTALLDEHFGADWAEPAPSVAVSEERLEQLRALGYVD